MEVQVRAILADGHSKTKMKTSDFRFKPIKGWLGGNATEKVGGWKTQVFEVSLLLLYCLGRCRLALIDSTD